MHDKIRLGLVGGIASGKSTVAGYLRELGWAVVDADKEAHQVYAPGTETAEKIRAEFGSGVVYPDGSVNRKALGAIVFADALALKRLEALVHPAARLRIVQRMEEQLEQVGRVVLETTLLYRWKEMIEGLDLILGVRCPEEIRIERLMARSGLDRDQARVMLAAQVSQAEILAPAKQVIQNTGTVQHLRMQLDMALERFAA